MGIDSRGWIYLMATEGTLLTMQELAELLQRPEAAGGLGLTQAMNLDGGGSTQLYAHRGDWHLDLQGETPVANGLGLFPR